MKLYIILLLTVAVSASSPFSYSYSATLKPGSQATHDTYNTVNQAVHTAPNKPGHQAVSDSAQGSAYHLVEETEGARTKSVDFIDPAQFVTNQKINHLNPQFKLAMVAPISEGRTVQVHSGEHKIVGDVKAADVKVDVAGSMDPPHYTLLASAPVIKGKSIKTEAGEHRVVSDLDNHPDIAMPLLEVTIPEQKFYVSLSNPSFRYLFPKENVRQEKSKSPEKLTPGYVAVNQGAVHTAPLPRGPSGDGFYASHHVNLAYAADTKPSHTQFIQTKDLPAAKTIHTPSKHFTQNYMAVQTPIFHRSVAGDGYFTAAQQETQQQHIHVDPGYVAANHGAVHTAPLPVGPSNDGFHASHHINLPDTNQKENDKQVTIQFTKHEKK